MDPTPGATTFADLLTPQGIVIAGGMITTLVAIVKASVPVVDRTVSGATLAFLLSAVLYVGTAFALPGATPDTYLSVLFAWIAVAAAAIGINSGADHLGNVRLERRLAASDQARADDDPDAVAAEQFRLGWTAGQLDAVAAQRRIEASASPAPVDAETPVDEVVSPA